MGKAIVYTRVSKEDQSRQGVSLDAQESRLRAYAVSAGLEVVEVIREAVISGTVPLALRPGGENMLWMIAQGKAEHVVVFKLDRLFRNTVDALSTTAAWDKAGIALHLLDFGGQALNTGSATGRFFLVVMAGFAELERNLIAERTALALAHKKATGKVYSPTPYGYFRSGVYLRPDEAEQEVLARIREARERGTSFRAIAATLNDDGIPTKTRGQWWASTVKYMAENDLNGGDRA